MQDAGGAALEGKMARTKPTGAFGKNGKLPSLLEPKMAGIEGLAIGISPRDLPARFILPAHRLDATEEEAKEEPPAELTGDEEGDARKEPVQNKAIGRSVAMETDKEDRTTLEIGQAFPMNEPHAIEVDPPNERVQKTMPERYERGHWGVIERSVPQRTPFSKLMFL
jgi:hypothetical protein